MAFLLLKISGKVSTISAKLVSKTLLVKKDTVWTSRQPRTNLRIP